MKIVEVILIVLNISEYIKIKLIKMHDEEMKEKQLSNKKRRSKSKFRTFLKNQLKNLSQGYYRTELYLEGQQRHASVMGGIMTLCGMFAVIGYAIFVLNGIFTKSNINVETTVLETEDDLFDMTVKDFESIMDF